MLLYLSSITISVVMLWVVITAFSLLSLTPTITILLILGAVACEFAIDGLFAAIVHFLPKKWFKIDNKFYKVSERERQFYENLKIRKWKDVVWELGGLGGFSKKKLQSSSDINYIKRFIIETNKGVLTHILGCFAGFLLLLVYLPFKCILQISLPIAILNMLFNLPPIFILRYNTPKLHAGYKRLLRIQDLKTNATE